MAKKILAVVVGVIVSGIVSGIIEMGIGHQVYPPPADLDITNSEMMGEYMANLPIGAFLFVIAGWLIGPLVGAFVAAKIAPDNWRKSAISIGVAIAVFALMSLWMIPHPIWMWFVGLLLPVPMAYIGAMLSVGKRKTA